MKIKLYIEGGGDSALQDTLFREGWQTFFQKAGLAGRMPKTFRRSGGSARPEAHALAISSSESEVIVL